jgi:hypothetical protein
MNRLVNPRNNMPPVRLARVMACNCSGARTHAGHNVPLVPLPSSSLASKIGTAVAPCQWSAKLKS